MNKVIIIGRLTQQPVLLKTKSGISYCRFTIAVNREVQSETTDFIPVVVWRQTADYISNNLAKGSLVSIEGSLESNRYQNAAGQIIESYSVTASRLESLESKSVNQQRRNGTFQPSSNTYNKTNNNDNLEFASEVFANSELDKPVNAFEPTRDISSSNQNDDDLDWTIDDLLSK